MLQDQMIFVFSVMGCLLTGLIWGLLNHKQKLVSLKDNDKKRGLKLAALFLLDKSTSLIFILSIQSISMTLGSLVANGSSIISSYGMHLGKDIAKPLNLLGFGFVLGGFYIFIS